MTQVPNTLIQVPNLATGLQQVFMPIQLDAPVELSSAYACMKAPWDFYIDEIVAKTVQGTGEFYLTINDSMIGVHVDEGNTYAEVATDGFTFLADITPFALYIPNGGNTAGEGSNLVLEGQSLRLVYASQVSTEEVLGAAIQLLLRRREVVETE